MQSLDEKTGKIVANRVNELIDMGNKTVYELRTESGRAVNTTSNHPYLARLYAKEECDKYENTYWNRGHTDKTGEFSEKGYCTRWVEVSELREDMEIAVPRTDYSPNGLFQSTTSKSSSSIINSLPLNSLTSAKNDDIADTSFLRFGGWITDIIIPEKSFGGNIDLLRKSESRETSTDFDSFDKEANLPLTIPFFAYSAEYPLLSSKRFTDLEIFSSSRNLGESGIALPANEFSSIFESSRNMLPGDRRVVFQNIFYGLPSSYQLNNITNQNSGAPESGLSMADFAVRNNKFAYFDSHEADNKDELFKDFYDNADIAFEKITSIKEFDKQQVYDLEIEGTHNFIANDIVAHNTNGDGSTVSNETANSFGYINTSGLVGLWHFNNESVFGENTTGLTNMSYDFSPDVNSERIVSFNGTFFGGSTINETEYKLGVGALELDGSNDFVDIFNSQTVPSTFQAIGDNNNYALSAWIKTDKAANTDEGFWFCESTIIELRDEDATTKTPFSFGIEDTFLCLGRTDQDNTGAERYLGTISINDGAWHHVAVSVVDNVADFYTDGVFDVQRTYTEGAGDASVGTQTSNMQIGVRSTDAGARDSNLFDGLIDEVSIWNRSLSSAEIKNLYKRGALRLNISVRSCDDSSCSGEAFSEQFTNSSGIVLNTSTAPMNRYFQYLAVLNTNNSNLTPVLYNVTINYTAPGTDRFGNYNATITAPYNAGTYSVKVNSTWDNIIPGEQLQTLTLTAPADTCSCPGSGDWVGSFADDCVITSNCNLQGNSLYLSGSGTWTINALIYNFNRIVAHQGNLVCIRQAGCFG